MLAFETIFECCVYFCDPKKFKSEQTEFLKVRKKRTNEALPFKEKQKQNRPPQKHTRMQTRFL